VGSVVDRAVLGQVSTEHFGFPCHTFIPLIAPQSSPFIIWGWYNRPINGRSNSGLDSTPAPKRTMMMTIIIIIIKICNFIPHLHWLFIAFITSNLA
jgi:hypothetical protein